MAVSSVSRRRRAGIAVATVAALAVAGLAAGTSYAGGTDAGATAVRPVVPRASGGDRGVRDPYVDVDSQDPRAVTKALRVQSRTAKTSAVRSYLKAAPDGTILDIDGTTGTVRWLADLDGFLTDPSSASPASIALDYVSNHADTLGLTTDDLATFHLKRDYRDISGTHHLFFDQRIASGNGQTETVASNGLTASVDRQGRLLTVGGSPVHTAVAPNLAAGTAVTTAAQALAQARGPVPAGTDTSDDSARKVLYATVGGLRPAWEATVTSSATPASTVIDAATGQVLLRTPYTKYENSTGRAYRFFPGARRGGHQVKVDYTRLGWLGRHATRLFGNNSHTFSDVNDNNRAGKSEEIHPHPGTHSFGFHLKAFHLSFAKRFCSNPWPCSWNPDHAYSWRTNRAQNATQVFFYVNNWHDHLRKAPIGFTEAAGNFQRVNHTKSGKGGDPVMTQTDDGANTDHGLPDGQHVDNANMSTPPDGRAPTMQMYLQHTPHTSYPGGDPFSPTNVGDEADTVYHEYTHGLSGRLNVDVDGRSTLGDVQAGAMGEAWSDWYAMDYLVKQGLQRDEAGKADVRLFVYDGKGVDFDRTEPIDCAVGATDSLCKGGDTTHRGGYTYADYGQVAGGPEVHADGEIWAQTLWDLRDQLGSDHTEALVTRAMELAPYNPSFIDMRNAILVADSALYDGADRDDIWSVFAHRGMGYLAGSFGGDDTTPAASFALPPATDDTGEVTGTVTDTDSGKPVAGVPVSLAFQGGGAPANPTSVTDADGHYDIAGVPAGHYAKLAVTGAGYTTEAVAVDVPANGSITQDLQIRRDWAASSGGGQASTPDGDRYQGCAPAQTIDLNQGTVWSTSTFGRGHSYHGKTLVVRLPDLVDVSTFAIDPAAGCGDGDSASLGGFRVDVSVDGTAGSWSEAATGTFGHDDLHRMNEVPDTAGSAGIQYVRLTMLGNQTPDYATSCNNSAGAYSGCAYTDLSELAVYGTAATS